MNAVTERFRKWMDSRNLSAADVADALNVSPATVTTWRSRGIPLRKQDFVQRFMDQTDAAQIVERLAEVPKSIILLPVDQSTFNKWNRAANRCGKIMEDWAIDGLDELAREQLPPSILLALRAADPPAKYGTPGEPEPPKISQ